MIRAIAEARQGSGLGASVALALTDKFLQLRRKQRADRTVFFRSDDSHLARLEEQVEEIIADKAQS